MCCCFVPGGGKANGSYHSSVVQLRAYLLVFARSQKVNLLFMQSDLVKPGIRFLSFGWFGGLVCHFSQGIRQPSLPSESATNHGRQTMVSRFRIFLF